MRWLLPGFIMSLSLNVAFLILLAYMALSPYLQGEKEASFVVHALKTEQHIEWIEKLQKLSYENLLEKLQDKTLIEDGLLLRDLALSQLVNKEYFNLSKAIGREPTVRLLKRKEQAYPCFVGLGDHDFMQISRFIKEERCPFTPEGLFEKLKVKQERAMLLAFCLTDPFLEIEKVVSLERMPLKRDEIASLLLSSSWQTLTLFLEELKVQKEDALYTPYQQLLLTYLEEGSKESATLFLRTQGAFAVKKLEDRHIFQILELLQYKDAHTQAFLKALLLSPRSDLVWQKVAACHARLGM